MAVVFSHSSSYCLCVRKHFFPFLFPYEWSLAPNCYTCFPKCESCGCNMGCRIFHMLMHLSSQLEIRKEALMGLGLIYKKYSLKSDPEPVEVERLSWMRNKLLHAYYQTNLEDKYVSLIECTIFSVSLSDGISVLWANTMTQAAHAIPRYFHGNISGMLAHNAVASHQGEGWPWNLACSILGKWGD